MGIDGVAHEDITRCFRLIGEEVIACVSSGVRTAT